MAQAFGSAITLEEAQKVLQIVQSLDPPGIGARDLRECLLLQVTDDTPLRDVVVTLITAHFEDLAANRLPVIERKTGYSIDTIKEGWDELKKLDPLPGRRFRKEFVQSVTPDAYLEQDEHGRYLVKLYDERTPSLRISRKYIDMLKNGCDPQTASTWRAR